MEKALSPPQFGAWVLGWWSKDVSIRGTLHVDKHAS